MGRPQFESVVAQATREYLDTISLSFTSPVAIGASHDTILYAPSGYIAQVVSFRVDIPNSGATTGEHNLYLSYETGAVKRVDLIKADSNFNQEIWFRYGKVHYAPKAILPVEPEVQNSILNNLIYDDQVGLAIGYRNQTEKIITTTREYFLTVRYKQIAG